MPFVQTLLTQSSFTLQRIPSPQRAHGPPQSTSASDSPRSPSEQVDTQNPLVHKWLMQSEFSLHFLPARQSGQFGPPQSASVSSLFSTPSTQLSRHV
jgi:hypothetical protein